MSARFLLLTVAVLSLLNCGTSGQPPSTAEAVPQPVRITQFYAPHSIARGENASLCYGVENAKSVRIDPGVEKIGPALTRCVSVSPATTTAYTLSAEDAAGHRVSQTLTIKIGPPLPRIIEVSINKTEAHPGEQIVVCYKASNAVSVDAGPGVPMTGNNPSHGCVGDSPKKTTTYQVRITGAGGGVDSERVTVNVK